MAMLIGKTITDVRALTVDEADAQGWAPATCKRTVAVVLSDGTIVFSASSAECDGPGALFAVAMGLRGGRGGAGRRCARLESLLGGGGGGGRGGRGRQVGPGGLPPLP